MWENGKEIQPFPGCATRPFDPGVRIQVQEPRFRNPGCAARPWAVGSNPFGVRKCRPSSFPGCACCAARPWAVGCNAFGVKTYPEGVLSQSPGSRSAASAPWEQKDDPAPLPRRGSITLPRACCATGLWTVLRRKTGAFAVFVDIGRENPCYDDSQPRPVIGCAHNSQGRLNDAELSPWQRFSFSQEVP
jgi:hypothetical protein